MIQSSNYINQNEGWNEGSKKGRTAAAIIKKLKRYKENQKNPNYVANNNQKNEK